MCRVERVHRYCSSCPANNRTLIYTEESQGRPCKNAPNCRKQYVDRDEVRKRGPGTIRCQACEANRNPGAAIQARRTASYRKMSQSRFVYEATPSNGFAPTSGPSYPHSSMMLPAPYPSNYPPASSSGGTMLPPAYPASDRSRGRMPTSSSDNYGSMTSTASSRDRIPVDFLLNPSDDEEVRRTSDASSAYSITSSSASTERGYPTTAADRYFASVTSGMGGLSVTAASQPHYGGYGRTPSITESESSIASTAAIGRTRPREEEEDDDDEVPDRLFPRRRRRRSNNGDDHQYNPNRESGQGSYQGGY